MKKQSSQTAMAKGGDSAWERTPIMRQQPRGAKQSREPQTSLHTKLRHQPGCLLSTMPWGGKGGDPLMQQLHADGSGSASQFRAARSESSQRHASLIK